MGEIYFRYLITGIQKSCLFMSPNREEQNINIILLSQFTERWKEEYLIGLMEAYKTKQNTNDICISTGDLVILKDDQTNRQVWKVYKVEELIKGADAKVRAAKVQVPSSKGKKILQRPLQHLIPIEVRCENESQHSIKIKADNENSHSEATAQAKPCLHDRPRRSAAAVADLVRRDALNIRYLFCIIFVMLSFYCIVTIVVIPCVIAFRKCIGNIS